MSTSYVKYRGKGFWSWDGYLEDALAVLAEAAGAQGNPDWLKDAGMHWTLLASGGFMGCIYPQFDDFLTTEDRCSALLRIIVSALGRSDLTQEAKATLEIASLVRGEIKTDASSPLDYMVSGEYRRMRK